MPDFGEGYSEDGFTRQRRNLIVGSIVLFFIHVADVRLGTQGSLFGIPISIGKPDVIQSFLYVGVLYWGWRFYTFYRQRRPVDMQTKAREYMHKFFEKRAIDHIKPPLASVGPDVSLGQRAELVPTNFHFGPFYRDRIEARIKPAWHITAGDELVQEQRDEKEYRIAFRGPLLWRARILGYTHASVNTPAFTEYFLPYLLFVVSVGYATFRSWPF